MLEITKTRGAVLRFQNGTKAYDLSSGLFGHNAPFLRNLAKRHFAQSSQYTCAPYPNDKLQYFFKIQWKQIGLDFSSYYLSVLTDESPLTELKRSSQFELLVPEPIDKNERPTQHFLAISDLSFLFSIRLEKWDHLLIAPQLLSGFYLPRLFLTREKALWEKLQLQNHAFDRSGSLLMFEVLQKIKKESKLPIFEKNQKRLETFLNRCLEESVIQKFYGEGLSYAFELDDKKKCTLSPMSLYPNRLLGNDICIEQHHQYFILRPAKSTNIEDLSRQLQKLKRSIV
jgi:hypothetical protein